MLNKFHNLEPRGSCAVTAPCMLEKILEMLSLLLGFFFFSGTVEPRVEEIIYWVTVIAVTPIFTRTRGGELLVGVEAPRSL